MGYDVSKAASEMGVRGRSAIQVPGSDLQSPVVEAREEAAATGGATRTCPVCGAVCFADMAVCYGCLHEFDGMQEVPMPEVVVPEESFLPERGGSTLVHGTYPQVSHVHIDLGSALAGVASDRLGVGRERVDAGDGPTQVVVTFSF